MVVEFIRNAPFIRKRADLEIACQRAQDQLLTSPDKVMRQRSPLKETRSPVGGTHGTPRGGSATAAPQPWGVRTDA
jgi:hypothetical protein